MAESCVPTVRRISSLETQGNRLAGATKRSRTYVATEAIRENVELNNWQVDETKTALDEADRGDFASEADILKTLKNWARRTR